MRRFIKSKPHLAVGVKVVLAVLAQSRSGAVAGALEVPVNPSENVRTGAVAVQKYAEARLKKIGKATRKTRQNIEKTIGAMAFAAASEVRTGTPMSYDEVRLFLQSYNAGPYACLKYKGTVPYRETRNYIPKIMKYYQQDLSHTPYEHIIVEKARKYGLDPQLIRAIMKTESSFNRKTVSHAGARGLMQVMPCVWSDVKKRYRFSWNYSRDVFDAEKNIEVACAYLAWLRYDFLPRHFEEFPANPEAPAIVKRDKRKIKGKRISARDQILITQEANKKKATAANSGV